MDWLKARAKYLFPLWMAMSLGSYAERWKSQAVFYSYLIHSHADLLDLCLFFLYGKIVSRTCIDMDLSTADEKHSIPSDYFERFDASLEAADIVLSVSE